MIRARVLALLVLWSGVTSASTGVVINAQGEPLEGVAVCYNIAGSDQLCVATDQDGKWVLPKSQVDTIRLSRKNYLTKDIIGGDHSEPVILERGATLLVKLQNAAGKPIKKGEIEVLYSSGKRIGPIPITRAAGTRLRSLSPGPVVIVARASGYGDGRSDDSELYSGKETVAVIRLKSK